LELEQIRKIYRNTEKVTLILLIVALPVFGLVYLYHNSGTLDTGLPQLPEIVQWILAGLGWIILGASYLGFHRSIRHTFRQESLVEKVDTYCRATRVRYVQLFVVSILASLGLLLTQNPMFTLIFAVTLVFFSLGKPSADRMARLMKLKKEDRELIREASRPQ
jgi:protein-S-isoprenylcysteine O-methyltransferase Ste14